MNSPKKTGSFEEQYTLGILTQQHALAYIGTKIRSARAKNAAGWSTNKKSGAVEDEAMDALANYVLNHVPVKNFNFRHKQIYVCHVIRRLLQTVLDRSLLDDKDYYGNKRLELAGDLYSLLFEDLFKRFNTEVKRSWDKALGKLHRENEVDVTNFMKTEVITGGFIHAISTGTWNLPRFKMDRAGVTQVLSRLSYISALGMMTRVNSNFEKTRKVAGPRSLQPSQWGMLCPADTPEGEQCGLVKNLALLAHVTSDEPVGPLYRACYDLGVEDVALLTGQEINGDDACVIFLNGLIVGVHARPVEFVHKLRYLRRRGCLGEFVSVYLNSIQRTVHIASDGGRICRPLLVIEYGRLRLTRSHMTRLERGKATMTDLIKAGIIEYVDVNEENNCFIALKEDEIVPETTHMEIDPLTVLGVVAGLIPFPHHNQSPRNTYQCAMGKQAMGTIGINQYKRFDSLLYTMVYPQKPMVKTRVLDLVNFDKVPGGQNATLAVMSFSGYDIEDAIVLNRASLDRGFGRCLVVKKHQTGLKRYSTVDVTDQVRGPPQVHEFPMREKDPRWKRYRALDHDGICCVGEKLEPGMIMVNKECPSNLIDLNERNTSEVKFKPAPLTYKGASHYGESVVDKVLITSTHNDMFLTKILLRQCRRPEVQGVFAIPRSNSSSHRWATSSAAGTDRKECVVR
jgi:DNA-directed RNA polymerase III subunit RPC2